MSKSILLITFFVSTSFAFSDSNSLTAIKSSTKIIRRVLKKHARWSVVVPSFVIHGFTPTNEASDSMPRKIDKSGNSVMTPGLGFKYEGLNHELFVAGLVKDCYDHLAGALQYGFFAEITKQTRWGLTFGFYFRETPLSCETSGFGNFKSTECHDMDRYDLKFQTQVNGVWVDIIPMPFLHFSTALYKDPDLEINFKMMSNFVLNEFAFAIPF